MPQLVGSIANLIVANGAQVTRSQFLSDSQMRVGREGSRVELGNNSFILRLQSFQLFAVALMGYPIFPEVDQLFCLALFPHLSLPCLGAFEPDTLPARLILYAPSRHDAVGASSRFDL
jgi:hypothetical protein